MSTAQTTFNTILALIVSTILSIYDSWVFSFIWNGFMPKTFGLPILGVVQAYLVLLIASIPFFAMSVGLSVQLKNIDDETPAGVNAIATSLGTAIAFTVALVMSVIWSQFL